MNKVAENIKNAIKDNKMTQEELAQKLSVTRQNISCWENGKSEPDIDTLMKISEIFEVNINSLLSSEINIKKSDKKHKTAIIIMLFIVLICIFLISNQNSDISTFYEVLKNPGAYSINIPKIENKYFKFSEVGNNIQVSKNDIDGSEYIFITECNYLEDGSFIISGKVTPIYQNKTGGKIFIPAVYSPSYFPSIEDFLNSISSYDYEVISKDFAGKTGSGVIAKNDSPFDTEYLLYATPFSYTTNKDGSIDFEFIFTKTPLNNSDISITDLLRNNGSSLIVLKCIALEWEINEPIEDIFNKISN